MLKLIITLFFLTGIITANSQSLVVKSFRWVNPDLKTTIPQPTNELKTNRYAIIKVETKQEGLTFNFDDSGKLLASVHNPGEIWLWVSTSVKKADITNSLTGEKYTFPFGQPLRKTELYVLVLDMEKLAPPTQNKKVEVQWLSIFSTPLGAQIMIDSMPAGITPFNGSLTMGTHSLELNCKGEVKKQEIKINGSFTPIIYMTFTGEGPPKNPGNEYFATDDAAQFPGGAREMMKFLRDKISYPKNALEHGIKGTVFLQFKVDETGKISDVKVLRGIGGGCDQEAMRVVKIMPLWKPAQFEGKPTTSLFTLPVKFDTMFFGGSGNFM